MHELTGVSGSVIVSIVDFSLVFAILAILALIMYSFKFLFAEKGKPGEVPKKASAFVPAEAGVEENTEIVAVIAAAIAACGKNGGRVISVKKVGQPAVSLWKLTARREAVGITDE